MLKDKHYNQIYLRAKNSSYVTTRFGKIITAYNKKVKLIIYPRNKWSFNVISILNHPKKGKTKLLRENLNLNEVFWVLYYPRIHSKKGR